MSVPPSRVNDLERVFAGRADAPGVWSGHVDRAGSVNQIGRGLIGENDDVEAAVEISGLDGFVSDAGVGEGRIVRVAIESSLRRWREWSCGKGRCAGAG